jgi:hypothetical protein
MLIQNLVQSSKQRLKNWNQFRLGNALQNWIHFLFGLIKPSRGPVFELLLKHSKRIEVGCCCMRRIWRPAHSHELFPANKFSCLCRIVCVSIVQMPWKFSSPRRALPGYNA